MKLVLTSQISSNCPESLSIDEFKKLLPQLANSEIIHTNKDIFYYNLPCAFDIESSSFYINDQKQAIMYYWTFGIGGYITYGRTWTEFIDLYNNICEVFNTDLTNRLVIYVHNLAYEFQFMHKYFEWEKVFSLEKRKPIQCITVEGVEFRCSYKLSGYSLANVANNLHKYKCHKLVGDLNYDLIRHSKTPLTKEEQAYCLMDTLIVMCYIQELIESEGNISKIPLTKTGFVRRYCRNYCLYKDDNHNKKYQSYRDLMSKLTLTPEIYKMLQEAFAGGFTHANAFYQGQVIKDVYSFDFTSSYPYVMISEKFPMSKGKRVYLKTEQEFVKYLNNYCCLFEVEFTNIKASVLFENYISRSKCRVLENATYNNGRVVKANRLVLTLTELDYMIIENLYEWEEMRIGKFYIFQKDYLPTDFVKSILDLYVAKTTLKGVEGKEVEYMHSKENVNSCYGMAVTNICREEIIYSNGLWDSQKPCIEEALKKNDKSKKRFLYYPWGVWVTAYARRNLFTGIIEFNEDYIYSDTDSIKVLNLDKHKNYIEKYNNMVIYKLKEACKHHNITFDYVSPKTIKGEEKTLGVWDFEGKYERFKTLGAKRYLVELLDKKTNRLVQKLTVAGLSKSIAIDYMKKISDDVFDIFNENLYIPKGETGKQVHTYLDMRQQGVVKDYLGVECEFCEESSVHLEPADYSFSLSADYINYLEDIKQIELKGS